MKIVVTGSIAYDYLMSFPGKFTEHFLPEHMQRLSLSFLVDTMDKRRGGCAPNIAYTLALLGERPLLMATAGEDFGEYRQWLEAAGVDTSLVRQVPGKFTASFFCSTDQAQQPDRVVLHRRDGRRRASCRFATSGTAASRSSRRTIPARWSSTPRSAARWASASSSIPASSARAMSGDELKDGIVGAHHRSSATTTSSSCSGRRQDWAKTRSSCRAKCSIVTRGEHGSLGDCASRGAPTSPRRRPAPHRRSDRCRRCVPRRVAEGHRARASAMGVRADRQRRRDLRAWNIWAGRAMCITLERVHQTAHEEHFGT